MFAKPKKEDNKNDTTPGFAEISVNYVDTRPWEPPGSSIIDLRELANDFNPGTIPDYSKTHSRQSSAVVNEASEAAMLANYNSKQTKSSSKKKKKLKII